MQRLNGSQRWSALVIEVRSGKNAFLACRWGSAETECQKNAEMQKRRVKTCHFHASEFPKMFAVYQKRSLVQPYAQAAKAFDLRDDPLIRVVLAKAREENSRHFEKIVLLFPKLLKSLAFSRWAQSPVSISCWSTCTILSQMADPWQSSGQSAEMECKVWQKYEKKRKEFKMILNDFPLTKEKIFFGLCSVMFSSFFLCNASREGMSWARPIIRSLWNRQGRRAWKDPRVSWHKEQSN